MFLNSSYLEEIRADRALEVVRDGGGRRGGVARLIDVPDGLVDLLLGVRLLLHLVHHEQTCIARVKHVKWCNIIINQQHMVLGNIQDDSSGR